MGRHYDAGRLGHGGDFPQRGDAAYVVDVGLQNVHDSHFDEFAASVCGDEPLSGSNRRGGPLGDAGHRLDVLRRARLLNEEEVKRLYFLHHDGGDAGAGFGVEVYGDVKIRAEVFPQHLHILDGALDLGVGLDELVVFRDAGFEARDPLLDGGLTQLLQLIRRARAGVVIAADALGVHRAA